MKQLIKTSIFGFNVKRREEFSHALRMAHQDDAKGSTGLSLIAVRAGFLQDACKDQWEEGWSQALLRDGLNLARQGIRVNDLQPQSSLPLPYVFCPLLTYQCICCRVSSKSFCLWGLKKKIYLVAAPSLQKFIIYTPTDFRREKLTLMCMRVTMIPSKDGGNPI